jgi:inosine/guanosine/xanthosine phosphorylase family protein
MKPPDPNVAATRLKAASELRPTLALVLGSGFHAAAETLNAAAEISFAKLPGFPRTSVAGHAGKAVLGTLDGTPVLVLSGRAHYYEGWSMDAVTFPMRVLASLGIQTVLLTNAAGGINGRFRPGDFMALSDHINCMGANPLRGTLTRDKPHSVDMSKADDPKLNRLLVKAARLAKVTLHSGVYLAVSGPSYETPAEIRAFARLGADAVGMSTVPEAIVARQYGLAVAGVSCITNLAAGRGEPNLSHAHVLAVAERFKERATRLLSTFVNLHGKFLVERGVAKK